MVVLNIPIWKLGQIIVADCVLTGQEIQQVEDLSPTPVFWLAFDLKEVLLLMLFEYLIAVIIFATKLTLLIRPGKRNIDAQNQ